MNAVFINSLEKKTGEASVVTAQVSIVEEHGKLRAGWIEPDGDGRPLEDLWYDGDSWEEMLAVFRYRLAEKMGGGFVPVIDHVPSAIEVSHASAKKMRMLQYYSEQHRNEELYEELRVWRRDRAVKDSKVPYMIANNRLLTLISAFIPHKEEELLQIPGIGRQKLSAYGEQLLKVTSKYDRNWSFPLDWVSTVIDEEQFRCWMFKQQEVKLKAAADELLDKKKLLRGIASGKSLNELQTLLSQPMREVVLLLEQLDAEGYDLQSLLEKEIHDIPESERNEVARQFDEKGDKYLKPVFEQVYAGPEYADADLDELYVKLRLLRVYYRQHKTAIDVNNKAVS